MSLDPRDIALQKHVPVAVVPRYSPRNPLARDGHCYLVADDGLWLEVRRPWLHFLALVAPVAEDGISLPYGSVFPAAAAENRKCGVAYAWEQEELDRLQSLFIYDARAALPDEFAAWGVWNSNTQRLEYRPLLTMEASPGGITFARPALDAHEHLAIDLHSHGSMDAFFSSTDDEDDAGEVKVAVVAGRLDSDTPNFATRLCCLGLRLDAGADQVAAYPRRRGE